MIPIWLQNVLIIMIIYIIGVIFLSIMFYEEKNIKLLKINVSLIYVFNIIILTYFCNGGILWIPCILFIVITAKDTLKVLDGKLTSLEQEYNEVIKNGVPKK